MGSVRSGAHAAEVADTNVNRKRDAASADSMQSGKQTNKDIDKPLDEVYENAHVNVKPPEPETVASNMLADQVKHSDRLFLKVGTNGLEQLIPEKDIYGGIS